MTEPTAIDMQQLLREIDEEVRARRRSGDFPAGLERDLDLMFARFAPPSSRTDDLQGLIESADQASMLDPLPPTASRVPGLSLVKRAERKALGWWFRYFAAELGRFTMATVEALRQLKSSIDRLEQVTPLSEAGVRAVALERVTPPAGALADVATAHVATRAGRVLVADSGDGALLEALLGRGTDAYGIDPTVAIIEDANQRGLDARADDVLVHLDSVAEGALVGMLLQGCVERLPLGALLVLADAAASTLGVGGRLAIISDSPAVVSLDPVLDDLRIGRPLHAETWQHLLEERGFGEVGVARGTEADGTGAGDRVDRLERLLRGAGPYVVTAVRLG